MKKVLKAVLYIPRMDLNLFRERCDYLNILLENKEIYYNTYLVDYENIEVINFEIEIIGNTIKEIDSLYTYLKKHIKSAIGENPKQVVMYKLDRIR